MAMANLRDDIRKRSGVIRTLLEQIQAEYAEMPGLSLTLPQAQRLWAADQATCEEVFSHFISCARAEENHHRSVRSSVKEGSRRACVS